MLTRSSKRPRKPVLREGGTVYVNKACPDDRKLAFLAALRPVRGQVQGAFQAVYADEIGNDQCTKPFTAGAMPENVTCSLTTGYTVFKSGGMESSEDTAAREFQVKSNLTGEPAAKRKRPVHTPSPSSSSSSKAAAERGKKTRVERNSAKSEKMKYEWSQTVNFATETVVDEFLDFPAAPALCNEPIEIFDQTSTGPVYHSVHSADLRNHEMKAMPYIGMPTLHQMALRNFSLYFEAVKGTAKPYGDIPGYPTSAFPPNEPTAATLLDAFDKSDGKAKASLVELFRKRAAAIGVALPPAPETEPAGGAMDIDA